jgi:hypothetical protein
MDPGAAPARGFDAMDDRHDEGGAALTVISRTHVSL